MMSFKIRSASRKDRIAGRFLSQVHAELARVAIEAKKETGCTQAGVANELGVDRAVISRLLSGAGNPTVRTIGELAGVLGYRPKLVLEKIERRAGANLIPIAAGNISEITSRKTSTTREQPAIFYGGARPTKAGV